MKAVVIREFGPAEGVAVVEVADPEPAPGQVLIAVEASGIGGVDAVIRRGVLAGYGFAPGHVLGSEVAGTVIAAGDPADAAWVGRRVWAFTGLDGGCVEYAIARVADLTVLPPALSAVDAVTLGGSGVVAHFGLSRARFAPGESVLIRGAAGSIGIAAVQLAARAGAGVVAVTTSSVQRGERLRALGATHVLDRAGVAASGETPTFDIVLDVAGGPELPSFLAALNPNGRMVVVGVVAGPPPDDLGAVLMAAFRNSLSFATLSTDTVPEQDRQAVRSAQFAAAARGELRTVVHQVLPLDQAVEAHRVIDSGAVFGRIVLTP